MADLRPGFNFPTSPSIKSNSLLMYPSDLIQAHSPYYFSLQIFKYERPNVLLPPELIVKNTIALPIPMKLNDLSTVTWERASTTAMGAALGSSAAKGAAAALQATGPLGAASAGVVGAGMGALSATGDLFEVTAGTQYKISLNPHLVMLFKTQEFKTHSFMWSFTPHNLDDSKALYDIIQVIKGAMLPAVAFGYALSMVLEYPYLVQPKLGVENNTYKFLRAFDVL